MAAILNDSEFTLKYLFKAEFADGTVYEQTIEDISLVDPKKSAFFDVLQKDEKDSRLLRFLIEGEGHKYLVDLIDGHFEIDGVSFDCHETLPHNYPDRRIIYYRKHENDFDSNPDGSLGVETAHRIWYCIGWQTTINGKNFKETITIN